MDYVIYFDGACQPVNPGGHLGIGVAILHNHVMIHAYSRAILKNTEGFSLTSNNIAEYLAFTYAVKWLIDNPFSTALILGDSQLVVRQMNCEWAIKNGLYKPYAVNALKMLTRLTNVSIEWIPREQNVIADRLSTAALKQEGIKITDFTKYKNG